MAAKQGTNWLKQRLSSVDWVNRDEVELDQDQLNQLATLHTRFVDGLAGGRRMNIALSDATGLDFSQKRLVDAELRGARLSESLFVGTDLTNANLFGADLRRCDMRRCNLSKADMRGAILRGSNLELARMRETDARRGSLMARRDGDLVHLNKDADTEEQGASLRGADLTGSRIAGETLVATDLSGAIMKDSQLSGADLSGCILRGVLFEGADLSGANLSGSILHGAVLRGAVMHDVNLESADLNAALFDSAALLHCDTSNAILPKSIEALERPIQEVIRAHYDWILTLGSKGIRAAFGGFDLTGLVFEHVELSAAEFSRSLLIDCRFNGANLSMSQFQAVNAMDCQFAGARLSGANFRYAVMTRADLRGIDAQPMPIHGARDLHWPTNFIKAVLDEANFEGANLEGVNFAEASLRGANLRRANLRGAVLRDADLIDADLRGANTSGADFSGAVRG